MQENVSATQQCQSKNLTKDDTNKGRTPLFSTLLCSPPCTPASRTTPRRPTPSTVSRTLCYTSLFCTFASFSTLCMASSEPRTKPPCPTTCVKCPPLAPCTTPPFPRPRTSSCFPAPFATTPCSKVCFPVLVVLVVVLLLLTHPY